MSSTNNIPVNVQTENGHVITVRVPAERDCYICKHNSSNIRKTPNCGGIRLRMPVHCAHKKVVYQALNGEKAKGCKYYKQVSLYGL